MTRLARGGVVLAVLLMIGGLAASCDAEQLPESPQGPETTAPPQDTEAPPETEAPPATEAPPDTEAPPAEDDTPWWVLLIVLFGLFVLIIALLVGGRRKKAAPAAAAWKPHAQHGYAEARWLSDNMTESLAIWHGDAEFDGEDASGAADASHKRVWDQLSPRMERATSELYALEAAAAPNSPALRAAQSTISALNDAFGAMNERSDARAAYRTVGGGDDPAQGSELTAARDREARASANLTDGQQRLNAALTDLSAIS